MSMQGMQEVSSEHKPLALCFKVIGRAMVNHHIFRSRNARRAKTGDDSPTDAKKILQTSLCTQGLAGGWSAPFNTDRKVKVEQGSGIQLGNVFSRKYLK